MTDVNTQTRSARSRAGFPRFPCLDGLRGLAIVSVLYSHGSLVQRLPQVSWWPFDGSPGVSVFFILTGLLVTTILLDEREKTGRVSVSNFLARRALRIWPALYVFLGATLFLRAAGWIDFTNLAWVAAATHWMNLYSGSNRWPLSHMWSLSLQEWFYLAWPFILTRLPARRALAICVAVVLAWPLVRLAAHGEAAPWPAHLALDNNGMNTIFCGALLALAMRERRLLPLLARLSHIATLAVCCAMLYALYSLHSVWPRELAPLLAPLRNLSVLGIVWWCINNPSHLFGRMLHWRPLVYLGAISFSLYLWQQLFLSASDSWLCQFPQNLIGAVAAGAVSYRLCELPARSLAMRFRAGRSAKGDASAPVGATASRDRSGAALAPTDTVEFLRSQL